MKNKAVNITISSETKEQIRWMIDNSSIIRNRSQCIAICVDHIYKGMKKYDEERKQEEAKKRIYDSAIEETVHDTNNRTIPADTIPADTTPADIIPADIIPADTSHSNHMPPKPKSQNLAKSIKRVNNIYLY
jgi:hypothetical protein